MEPDPIVHPRNYLLFKDLGSAGRPVDPCTWPSALRDAQYCGTAPALFAWSVGGQRRCPGRNAAQRI